MSARSLFDLIDDAPQANCPDPAAVPAPAATVPLAWPPKGTRPADRMAPPRWLERGPAPRKRVPNRVRPVASRCVGTLAVRPLTPELADAAARTLADLKHQCLRGELEPTAKPVDGCSRTRRGQEGGE